MDLAIPVVIKESLKKKPNKKPDKKNPQQISNYFIQWLHNVHSHTAAEVRILQIVWEKDSNPSFSGKKTAFTPAYPNRLRAVLKHSS